MALKEQGILFVSNIYHKEYFCILLIKKECLSYEN